MAGNFRLTFNDIDTSQGLGTIDSSATGYMVVKAPKGNAVATYFPKGSANKIISLVGVPSTTYPNIQDALDFNASYGLYLSSPAGTSNEYESYYGGVYLTEYGIFEFDRVTDISEPNYLVRLDIEDDTRSSNNVLLANSTTKEYTTGIFTIDNVPSWIYSKAVGLRLTYVEANPTFQGTVIDIVLDKTDLPNGLVYNDIVIGAIDASNQEAVLFTLEGADGGSEVNWATGGAVASYFNDNWNNGGITFEWILNLSSDTYFYLNQRSPSEVPAHITVSKIGYVRSASCASSVLTCANHSLSNKTAIKFSNLNGLTGTPAISTGTTYYVSDVTTNTFKIRLTPNSVSAISLTGTIAGGIVYTEVLWPTNQISFSFTEEGAPGRQVSGGTYTGNLVNTSVDGYGANNYIENLLTDDMNAFVQIKVVKPFTNTTSVTSAPQTLSVMGQRYAVSTGADLSIILQEGWDAALAGDYDTVRVFMEPTGNMDINASLPAIRQAYQLSTIISALNGTGVDAAYISSLHDARSSVSSAKGLAYYANQFLRKDNYLGTTFWSNCIGAIGTKLASIIEGKLGGWPPMFTDYNGYGGSLPVSAIKQKAKFNNDDQQLMDQLGINIIVQDSFHGPLILGQKTSTASLEISDWSYLAHSMAFDEFKREIRDLVMVPQLGKPIDDQFQSLREFQSNTILNKRTQGPGRIWEAGLVDAFAGNDAAAKAARTFKLIIQVKVTVFSEFVDLTLENVGQGVTL